MPDAGKLKKLVDLRRARGKSQRDSAVYFGLAGSARNEISKWENGEKIPPPKYRERFVGYLCDFLALWEDRDRFDAMWSVVSDEWGWDQPTEQELRPYFSGETSLRLAEAGYESTRAQAYYLLGIPLWSVRRYEGHRRYYLLGLPIWSSVIPARYAVPSLVTAVLGISALVAGSFWGRGSAVERERTSMLAVTAVATPTIWDRREGVGIRCDVQDYASAQGTVKTKVCAWLNVDYTNDRMRGYSSIEHVEGPSVTLASTIRLRQGGRIVYERATPWTDKTYIRPATELRPCADGDPIVAEVEALVSYPDGQRRTYTIVSESVASRC